MDFLKLLVWLASIGLALWTLYQGMRREGGVSGISVLIAAFLVVIAALLTASFGQVPAGYRGLVLQFGAPTGQVLGEGFYMVFPPFIRTVELMSVQVHAYETNAEAASRDLQIVKTQVTLNYSLSRNPSDLVRIYRDLRHEYLDRIIRPAIQEAVKAATARFTAEELITRRPDVRQAIEDVLRARLERFGIRIEAMSITDFDFSDAFNAAIEAKVTAQQQALKAARDLERVKLEAQQKIEQARAEAEALRIQKQNVTPELVELRRIEAQMKAIEKWDGRLPEVVTGTGPVPLLDVFQRQSTRPRR
jgi:regulator of protease activity HflC (stomatin/prohibitin superfamily)